MTNYGINKDHIISKQMSHPLNTTPMHAYLSSRDGGTSSPRVWPKVLAHPRISTLWATGSKSYDAAIKSKLITTSGFQPGQPCRLVAIQGHLFVVLQSRLGGYQMFPTPERASA